MKKTILMAYVVIGLVFVSTAQKYKIGLNPALGGFVFQLSADKKHGLVAETKDIKGKWTFYAANEIMKLSCVHSSVGAKFLNWRLPTKDELSDMYSQKDAIGGFAGEYWSSSEGPGNSAWVMVISEAWGIGQEPKDSLYRVRAVRAF